MVQSLALCLAVTLLNPRQRESVTLLTVYRSPDLMILAYLESGFLPLARSPVGAKGVMQLTSIAVKEVYIEGCGTRKLPTKFDIWNPKHNILVGYCYFTLLQTKYKLPLKLAVAAYNMGPSRVYGKWPRETRNYVRNFYKLRGKKCLHRLFLPPL